MKLCGWMVPKLFLSGPPWGCRDIVRSASLQGLDTTHVNSSCFSFFTVAVCWGSRPLVWELLVDDGMYGQSWEGWRLDRKCNETKCPHEGATHRGFPFPHIVRSLLRVAGLYDGMGWLSGVKFPNSWPWPTARTNEHYLSTEPEKYKHTRTLFK